jgi:hypothetical protein
MNRLVFSPGMTQRIGYEFSAAIDGLTVYAAPAAQVFQQAFENIFADREIAEFILSYLLSPGGPLMPEPQQPPIVYTVDYPKGEYRQIDQVFIKGVPVGWVETLNEDGVEGPFLAMLGAIDNPDTTFAPQPTFAQARDLVAHAWLERHGLRFNRS